MESVWITVCAVTALPLAFVALPALVDLVVRLRRRRTEPSVSRTAVPPARHA